MGKKLVVVAFTVLLALSVSATGVEPGEKTVIDSNVSVNTSVVSATPFDVSLNGSNLSVSPGFSFDPGSYEQIVQFENSSKKYNLTLKEYTNWTASTSNFSATVDIGSNPSFDNITLNASGNAASNVDAEVEGNLSDYVSSTTDLKVYPSISKKVVLSVDNLPDNAETGTVTGKLVLTGENKSEEVNLSFTFRDNISPRIEDFQVSDYAATKPENFSLTCTDNKGCSTVVAEILNETTVQEGNETVTVNKTISTVELSRKENTDKWTGMPGLDKVGDYLVRAVANDSAGNNATVISSLTVSMLDVIEIRNEETLNMPVYRSGNGFSKSIGEIKQDTELEVKLESFNPGLDQENSTWQLAVISSSSGKKTFDAVNSTLSFDQAGNLELFLYSDSAARYNGKISFSTIDQHTKVEDLRFDGQFKNCRIPQRRNYTLIDNNINVTFKPVNSSRCGDSGWTAEYFIPSTAIPRNSELSEQLKVLTPNNYVDTVITDKEAQVSTWKQRADSNGWEATRNALFAGFFLFLAVYFRNLHPTMEFEISRFNHYSLKQKFSGDEYELKV